MIPVTPARKSAVSLGRWLALTSLGAAILAAPLAASGQPVAATRHIARSQRRETLDERISTMHAALHVTPAEEADWAKVADVMRRNDGDMQKLVAARQAQAPHELTAVDDLVTYEKFTQAHLDGLKDLISSFAALYGSMPEDQKVVADHVFARFGRETGQTRGTLPANG
jgi:hypothetical protein